MKSEALQEQRPMRVRRFYTMKGARCLDDTEILNKVKSFISQIMWINILVPICCSFLCFGNLYDLSQFSHL